jgi:PKD repeat protein
MKKLVTILLVLSFSIAGWAQIKNWCGTPYFDSIAVANDPSIIERRNELERFTKAYLQQPHKSYDKIIIPVVFHVLHQYGDERIDMSVIENCIESVNKDYAGLNNDLNDVIAEFRDIIGTVNVELRLAKIDPDGNPTTGVIYYKTDLTYNASNNLKYTIKNWDPSKYLNIWTVASIDGDAAAWSHYPGVSSALDGVVSIYKYLTYDHTISHEIGHYLNLMHTWGNSNEPGLASNCDIDDGVEDTPNTIGTSQTCHLNQSTCDTLDNVQNIMDYSTCPCMLTLGQITRMRAALNSSIGSRNNLWTEANLIATGTNDGYVDPGCAPVADFLDIEQIICPGTKITFKDCSYGGTPLSWKWEFEGGEPTVSSLQNATVAYNAPGVYKVKLTVTNDEGQSSIEHIGLVTVNDTVAGFIAPDTIDFEDAVSPFYAEDPAKTWYTFDDGDANWSWYASDTNKAFRINNFNNDDGVVNCLISPSINLSKVVPPDYIYFDWAYSQRNSKSDDNLKVYVSSDCGNTWGLRLTKSGKSLSTTGTYTGGEFIPSSTQWSTGKLDIKAFKKKSHIEVKFMFERQVYGGNYLYIDNLKVEGTPIVGVTEKVKNNQLIEIYPNPAKDFTVSFSVDQAQSVKLSITNSIGKLICSRIENVDSGISDLKINSSQSNMPAGIYYVTIVTKQYTSSKKVIVY